MSLLLFLILIIYVSSLFFSSVCLEVYQFYQSFSKNQPLGSLISSIVFVSSIVLCFVAVFQLLSNVWLSVTAWTVECQVSLSFTISRSLLKLMSVESVMPSNHLILCHLLLLLPSVFPSIRVLSNESVLCIRQPKYWSFSLSICPSNGYSGLISYRIDRFHLLAEIFVFWFLSSKWLNELKWSFRKSRMEWHRRVLSLF